MKKIKTIINKILKLINFILPKRYISFLSIPDFADNPQALFDYIIKNKLLSKYKVFIWHLNDRDTKKYIELWIKEEYLQYSDVKIKLVYKYSIQSIVYFMLSKIIIDSHGSYKFKIDKQVEFFLWHGMPLKKLGDILHKRTSKRVSLNTYYSVTAAVFKGFMSRIFNADESLIYIDGQCRNDYLFNKIDGYKGIKKYIIFLPTYRRANHKYSFNMNDCEIKNDLFFNFTEEEILKIDKKLVEKDIVLFIKPHVLDDVKNRSFIEKCTMIKMINEKELLEERIPLYKFVSGSEALITDFSSIYIDYLLTNKPIAHFVPDIEEYNENRGFIVDNLEDMMVNDIYTKADEVIDFIENLPMNNERYQKIKNYFHTIQEPNASKKILMDFCKNL